jgi:predicted amidohydrolase
VSERAPLVAAVQLHAGSADPADNLRHAVAVCEEAACQGAQLLVLPELFTLQYTAFSGRDPGLLGLAEPLDGPTTRAFGRLAAERRVWVVVPLFERAVPGVAFDSAVLIGPDGAVRGVYRKTHVALLAQEPSGQEKFYFRAGNRFPVWDTEWGRLGILICYDRNFPEAWRLLVRQGAELIAVPITTDGRWLFRELAQVLCYLNGVYGVFANRVGVERERTFFGGSLICGPRGEVLAEAGADEAVVRARADLAAIAPVRAAMPFLRDLRPELYGPLATDEPG